MKLKPLNDHVILKPVTREEMTKSGIFLPEAANKERPERGQVVAVGDGKIMDNGQRVPMSVKVGDEVVFKKYSPDDIKIDGEEFLIIRESDVMAILE